MRLKRWTFVLPICITYWLALPDAVTTKSSRLLKAACNDDRCAVVAHFKDCNLRSHPMLDLLRDPRFWEHIPTQCDSHIRQQHFKTATHTHTGTQVHSHPCVHLQCISSSPATQTNLAAWPGPDPNLEITDALQARGETDGQCQVCNVRCPLSAQLHRDTRGAVTHAVGPSVGAGRRGVWPVFLHLCMHGPLLLLSAALSQVQRRGPTAQ